MKLLNTTAFAIGLTIGYIVGWYCTREKYEATINEEIMSTINSFKNKTIYKESDSDQYDETEDINDDVNEYVDTLHNEGYTNIDNITKPYVIRPEEFATCDDYSPITLYYYSDGILADDNDEKITDIDNTVGYESLNTFGKYDDDSVYVRNERLKVDYEILKSLKTYKEVIKPYHIKEE